MHYLVNISAIVANTIEPSVCGGDAAFCQITLTACQNKVALPLFGRRRVTDAAASAAAKMRRNQIH